MGQGNQRVWFCSEEKGGSIMGFLPKLLWGNVLLGWHFTQRGECGLGPLGACHRGRWRGSLILIY